ncbi:MAG: glutamate synthase subunit beta [Candidatus Limnocylindrales bacterium]
MGRPSGFIEIQRRNQPGRPPLERIRDWSEAHPHLSEGELADQGARCMDCGVPWCHTGVLISGMASGCPINNLIPEWNDLVYRGQWREASIRLHRTNNFPEFTGRVCPAPCEGSCTVGLNGDPVAIKTIEQEIADRAWDEGWVTPNPPLSRTGRSVAVIGSGPAGLAAADQLNRAGHLVTVYERAGRIGGLLMYGIPNMKLDKDVVGRRTRLMEAEGVTFITGVTVGADIAVDEMVRMHDAVVIATGATVARDLAIPGRELGGIHLAMSYLRGNTRRLLDGGADADAPIDAAGKDVVVIGGGDTGTDCVGTAIRQGARSVRQLELLGRPPTERAANNPWPEWPKVYKVDYGQEEAQALWGEDPRRYSTTTRRFIGRSEHVTGVEIADLSWQPGSDGRIGMREVPGTAQVVAADLVLLALGFLGPEPALPKAFECELDARGNVRTDTDKMTSMPGVFAAGDCSRGQSLVVWAIKEGRMAAEGVDRYLSRN